MRALGRDTLRLVSARTPSRPEPDLEAVVHDTTNALTVILGWLERARAVAATQSPDAEQLSEALARATAHARETRELMRAALGAGGRRGTAEAASAIAARTLEDLSHEAEQSGVPLRAPAPAADGLVFNAHAVWQILTNLLLNAIAHARPGTEVTLTLDRDEAGLVLRVRDEGPGVAEERREAIFTGGASDREGGAGIGLRHARALARAAGGELLLEHSNHGACFALHWPIATAAESAGRANPAPRGRRRGLGRRGSDGRLDGRRILLLEDDTSIVELLELSLGARGADVTTVRTATALERAFDEGCFDALLLDLSPLSGELQPELVARARDASPGLRVVVISGSAIATPPGVTWLRKPFEPSEVVDAILLAGSA